MQEEKMESFLMNLSLRLDSFEAKQKIEEDEDPVTTVFEDAVFEDAAKMPIKRLARRRYNTRKKKAKKISLVRRTYGAVTYRELQHMRRDGFFRAWISARGFWAYADKMEKMRAIKRYEKKLRLRKYELVMAEY